MANILVTGGAGYIGSHACKALAAAGHTPVTFDNLVTGWRNAVKFGPFVQGDLLNRAEIDAAFEQYQPVAVMHFAALSQVGDSMKQPGTYWRNNVEGSLNLIEATVAAGCADQNANIEGIELSERDEHYSTMRLVISVRDRTHLANVDRILRIGKRVARVLRNSA